MSAERPVLIVDDDDALRETWLTSWRSMEFVATEAASVQEAELRLGAKDARFDAVILDVGLPDGDGRDLCAELRRQGQRMPIIMLTGSDGEKDVVRGLDAVRTTTSPSRSSWPCCSRVCALSCGSSRTARTRFSHWAVYFRPAAKLLQEPARGTAASG